MEPQNYEKKEISLNKNLKLIFAVKKIGLETYSPNGKWNGYGYERMPLVVVINSLSEMRKYKKIEREILALPPKKYLTDEEIIKKWAKRLSKLTGIDEDEAIEIANEKIEYKQNRIDAMDERQCVNWSMMRDKLIRKMEREAPLRRIQDEEHAENILCASRRHNSTNYDSMLNRARELASEGEIDISEIKEYARENFR